MMLPSTPKDVPSWKSPFTVTRCRLVSVTRSCPDPTAAATGPNSGREYASKRTTSGYRARASPASRPGRASAGRAGSRPSMKMSRVAPVSGFFQRVKPV